MIGFVYNPFSYPPPQSLEGHSEACVYTYQGRSFRSSEKLLEAFHLARFVYSLLTPAEVEARSHRPVAEEGKLLQFRILERASDALFGHRPE